MRVSVRVREQMCAAVSLQDPHLSEAENRKRFGHWMDVHGHDFTVDVEVTGPVSPLTGTVIEYTALRSLVRREIVDPVDHKRLNDVEMLRGMVPTIENMARVFFQRLQDVLTDGMSVACLSVQDGQGNATIVRSD